MLSFLSIIFSSMKYKAGSTQPLAWDHKRDGAKSSILDKPPTF